MTSTANLDIPLVQASQAQKHVTVNEALSLLDGLCQLTIQSATLNSPPLGAVDGSVYAVPAGASDEWSSQDGMLAIASNGGWRFLAPRIGWRGYLADAGQDVRFDGQTWQPGAVAASATGAASVLEVREVDVELDPGTEQDTAIVVPAGCVVFGVTGRVTAQITGGAASWRLGVPGSDNRYGSGLGKDEGSWVAGLTGQPQAYYVDTSLKLTAEGGDFAGGSVRLAVHLFRMTLPGA